MGLVRKLLGAAFVLGAFAAVALWFLSAPSRLDAATVADMGSGDAGRGERIFWAGGCASCHARPKSEGSALLELAGGVELNTPFGKFVSPNVSSHPRDGIGSWSMEDFANAVLRGVSPEGAHYYPAFPYSSYARMLPADVADLYAFMKTLPAVEGKTPDHSLGFPFNIRRGLGLWKQLYLSDAPIVALEEGASDAVKLGRYLVEGAGHCGECHTPRAFTGGIKKEEWLAGAIAAEGTGTVPNITPGSAEIGDWSEDDIITLLETGFTPDFDSPGGAMADVVKNTANLTAEDRIAIAAYLKAVPARADGFPLKTPPTGN